MGEVAAVVARGARVTGWCRSANPSTVKDEHVRSERPVLWRQHTAQVCFHALGAVILHDAQSVGHAEHVPIDWQAGDAEGVTENHVGCLATNAR